MRKKKFSGRQEIFIDIANNDYATLVWPKTSLEGMAESLMRIKANAEVDYKEAQSNLIKILDGIVKDKKLQDSKELRYFIEARERLSFTHRVENGRLIKGNNPKFIPYPHWFTELAYDFIDYLSNPETDIREIKRCENEKCGRFYRAKKIDSRRKWCSEKCGNAARRWSNERVQEAMKKLRKKKKDDEEKEIKDKQIQRFIKAGYSPKEAEREWLKVRKEMMHAPKDFELVKRNKPVKRHTSRLT